MSSERKSAAIILIHDWYGRLPHLAAVKQELEQASFTVKAVDLYAGRVAKSAEEAEALMSAVDDEAAIASLKAEVAELRRDHGVVAALGYSMGGWFALTLARDAVVDQAVAFYSILPDGEVPAVPVQLHLAEVDDWGADTPANFVHASRRAGAEIYTHTYAGTMHSFANGDVPAYDQRASSLALARSVTFLLRYL